jgi:hypothetical protein
MCIRFRLLDVIVSFESRERIGIILFFRATFKNLLKDELLMQTILLLKQKKVKDSRCLHVGILMHY